MFRILIIAIYTAFHPVHVSIASFEYSIEDEAFRGFLKVYYDDFLLDLRNLGGISAEPDFTKKSEEANEILLSYLDKRFNIFAGDRKLNPEISEVNLSGNELKLDLLFKFKKRSKTIKIYNSILSDLYNDQANMVILHYRDFEEGVKLSPENREHLFKIK